MERGRVKAKANLPVFLDGFVVNVGAKGSLDHGEVEIENEVELARSQQRFHKRLMALLHQLSKVLETEQIEVTGV